jgi:uncharacterized small protein (TIGR04563 family)
MGEPRAVDRKQSLYFPEEMLVEIREEATRLDRSLSWVVQRAWKLARNRIRAMPSDPDVVPVRKPD